MTTSNQLASTLTQRVQPLRTAAQRAADWMAGRPHSLGSVAVIRAVVGLCGLAMYLSDYRIRHLLFMPEVLGAGGTSSTSHATGSFLTLYRFFGEGVGFEVVYHLGILAALAVMLGVGGRIGLAIHYVLIWSLYAANPLVLDGGDNLVMILGLVLLLTRCYDRLNLRSWLSSTAAAPRVGPVATIAHNTGVLLIAAQICVVYLMAGLYKVQGQLWQDGTALYYILRTPEFHWPGVTEHVFAFEWFLVIGAYATVWLSIYFPLMVLVPRLRLPAVLLMSGFHLSIAVLMGLTSFALIMIACDLVFVNRHVERAGRSLARAGARLATMVRRPSREDPDRPEAVPVPAPSARVTSSDPIVTRSAS